MPGRTHTGQPSAHDFISVDWGRAQELMDGHDAGRNDRPRPMAGDVGS